MILLSFDTEEFDVPREHGVTGGVYKARERIHRSMLRSEEHTSELQSH